jgi:N-acetylglucosamine-6-phosphate deacetylase
VAAALVDGALLPGDISVAGERILDVGLTPAGAGIALPGLIDLQVNGFGGVDLLTAEHDDRWRAAGERLLEHGVTAYLPTLITAPSQLVSIALERAARLIDVAGAGARVLGVHLEGPFISAERLGTHPPEYRRDPDPELMERFLRAGPVAMVTLAPELPGAQELIETLVARGIVVSLGHTLASAADAHMAFDHGARAVTHIFNAMAPIRAREPGVAGVALSRADVTVLCIADGVHLADESTRLVLAAARDRTVLTSDAIAAAGQGDGDFMLGTVNVSAQNGVATRPDGTLAGSVGTVIGGLRRAVELGSTIEAAARAATIHPARLLGRTDVGVLHPGARADVVVLDDSLAIERVLINGKEAGES